MQITTKLKVGDIAYYAYKTGSIFEIKITRIIRHRIGTDVKCKKEGSNCEFKLPLTCVFATKAEAEQKLKELRGDLDAEIKK